MSWFRRGAVAVLALPVLSACGGEEAPATPGRPAAASAGYAAPPLPLSIGPAAGGGVLVRGRAAPEARVRALTTAGSAYGATAASSGAFVLELPASPAPRLIALSSQEKGRSVHAEGWLFVPPDAPARGVALNPGAAATPLAGAGLIAAVDYDAGGGAAVAGLAAPRVPVKVWIDGAEAAEGFTDETGAYGLRAEGRVPPGDHEIRVQAGERGAAVRVRLAAAAPGEQFMASRDPAGWHIGWRTPGGGAQTTVVLSGGARP
ncbi:MAG TPA: hypothetical protein VD929_01355 [Caulobacteraceae bacterium]|nr:hypothetical protein [Caulobacteraceae bacterium]